MRTEGRHAGAFWGYSAAVEGEPGARTIVMADVVEQYHPHDLRLSAGAARLGGGGRQSVPGRGAGGARGAGRAPDGGAGVLRRRRGVGRARVPQRAGDVALHARVGGAGARRAARRAALRGLAEPARARGASGGLAAPAPLRVRGRGAARSSWGTRRTGCGPWASSTRARHGCGGSWRRSRGTDSTTSSSTPTPTTPAGAPARPSRRTTAPRRCTPGRARTRRPTTCTRTWRTGASSTRWCGRCSTRA